MVFILRCLLVVVNNIIINTIKFTNYGLLLARILATSNCGLKLTHDLITITKIVLHSCSTGFIVIHVKHLTKVLWRAKWTSVTH
nr:AC5 protein [Mungbean yellow mosaic virus]